MTQWQNFKVKAAVGSVLPPEPGATYHCRPIPEGYARVMVDEITEGFEDLQLDHPTGEGETRLGSALKTPCLWRKELINLPNKVVRIAILNRIGALMVGSQIIESSLSGS